MLSPRQNNVHAGWLGLYHDERTVRHAVRRRNGKHWRAGSPAPLRKGSSFCSEHGLTRLVYCEHYERIEDAIAREKAMKAWQRRWKTKLIEKANPKWADLFKHAIEGSF